MSKQEKRRLYIIGAIIVAAVVLLLLARRRAVAGNTVINQAGDFVGPQYGGSRFDIGDIPPLNFSAGKTSARGCATCYPSYSRISVPSAPIPAINIYEQNRYVSYMQAPTQPVQPPPQPRRSAMTFGSGTPTPPSTYFPYCNVGRCI